ncbi:MAG TPA: hypothetical protein VKB52_10320 [Rhodanobacteraceae bacterium]|nr:hypothetical protein [Rhodanobacteraceae bacterium]
MPNREDHARYAHNRSNELRRRIAVEAARLIAEGGLRDYRQAKLKAASRLGITDDLSLPKNGEIEEALREHQRLFRNEQPATLQALREAALEAMRFFADFEPRLVGPVLEGTADEHSAVCLHLHDDGADRVAMFLQEKGIPYEERTRRLRLERETTADVPVFVFSAGDSAIDITVLPYDRLRQAPLDRIDEKPMRRANLATVEELVRGDDAAPQPFSAG